MYLENAWNNGDLEMIQWLHKKNIKGCTKYTMYYAVVHNRLDKSNRRMYDKCDGFCRYKRLS